METEGTEEHEVGVCGGPYVASCRIGEIIDERYLRSAKVFSAIRCGTPGWIFVMSSYFKVIK